jgi:hypothetical protein
VRLRVKGTTFFGQYMGTDRKSGKVLFLDEETHKVKKYPPSRLEKTYEKENWWRQGRSI